MIAFTVMLLGCCGYCLWRGGRDERYGASVLLLGAGFSILLMLGDEQRWLGLEVRLALVDLAMFVALMVLALRTDKYWPLALAGFQLTIVMGHVLSLVSSNLPAWQYWLSSALWSWFTLAPLAFGIINHERLRERSGI